MILTIKQLKQQGLIFVPQTTAEAVLVKNGEEIITLDKLLLRRVEGIVTPVGSGLQSYKQENNIVITHSNSITANDSPSAVKIQYDSRGHVIETAPTNSIVVTVDNAKYLLYNGSEDLNLLLGNDFGIDENKRIELKWNYL